MSTKKSCTHEDDNENNWQNLGKRGLKLGLVLSHIQLFRERLLEKMCTRQSPKVTWDMINTLFVTIVAVEFICGAFL